MCPERVTLISQDAQAAARQAAFCGQAKMPNPYPARTREFVLWEATFYSALSDFAELAAEPAPPGQKDGGSQAKPPAASTPAPRR